MNITVCVGSSCHLKGSNRVIERLEKLIEENGLENRVVLKASFCMGNCTKGVSATINGIPVDCLDIDNVEEFFYEHIRGVVVQ